MKLTLIKRAALLMLLSTLNSQPSTFAQGTSFTYQGRLNEGASPANGSYDLTFSLWSAAAGPTQVGNSLSNVNTAVSNGLFTVSPDFGANFPGADRWLEIAVRTNGGGGYTTLIPRQKIVATPYAITASNLTGMVASSQLSGTISSNNLGAGTITATMLANGAVGSNQLASGAVTTSALAEGAVTAAKVASVSNWFALTIVNPTPAASEFFGASVATFGSDRMLIGATFDDTGGDGAGAAYLFSINGTLLTTFNNPTPAGSDNFGNSVAAVGNDRVLIGAYLDNTGAPDAGAAYLFSTNGTLLTTFTNPAPFTADLFGRSVTAVGGDRVLIGADSDNVGAADAGAAYLFSTDGTLLVTFTNPTPEVLDSFGWSVAAVGNDRVLIGADRDNTGAQDAGAAYLFNTNGTLLTTFTNPTPANIDNFGGSVAAVGTDRVLIGANRDDTGAQDAGAAYLFSLNGTLLTTFTNPAPANFDNFGDSVAAVGSDRVLIGAESDDAGTLNAGAAYLFNTNGTLLVTFTNPVPATNNLFGGAVAAVGTDHVLVGTRRGDNGAADAGAAYLFGAETFTPGLVADAVRFGGATLDPTIGVWTGAGNNVYRLTGNVGIGTPSPQASLHVVGADGQTLRLENRDVSNFWNIYTESFSGNLLFTYNNSGVYGYIRRTDGNYFAGSDARLKQDITALGDVLDRVLQMRPVSYHMRSASDHAPRTLGLIAQEVEPLFPEVVGEHAGMKSLAYSELVPVTIGAIQELNQKMEDRSQRSEDRSRKLEEKLQQKETEITELKERLEALEKIIRDQRSK